VLAIPLLILLGYPGFDPPRPGQPEDTLTEQYVKSGYAFVNTALVSPCYLGHDSLTYIASLGHRGMCPTIVSPHMASYTAL
jgi:hypothetical protein